MHVVTARAVAPLDRLAGWGVPLLRPYGEMLALKGDAAEEELKGARAALSKLGVVETSVVQVGEGDRGSAVHRGAGRGGREPRRCALCDQAGEGGAGQPRVAEPSTVMP